jgi:hypothetical protein
MLDIRKRILMMISGEIRVLVVIMPAAFKKKAALHIRGEIARPCGRFKGFGYCGNSLVEDGYVDDAVRNEKRMKHASNRFVQNSPSPPHLFG